MRISDWSSTCALPICARDPLQIDALGFGDARGKRADLDPVGQARARQQPLRPGSWRWSGGPCPHRRGWGSRRHRPRRGVGGGGGVGFGEMGRAAWGERVWYWVVIAVGGVSLKKKHADVEETFS